MVIDFVNEFAKLHLRLCNVDFGHDENNVRRLKSVGVPYGTYRYINKTGESFLWLANPYSMCYPRVNKSAYIFLTLNIPQKL